MASYFLSRFILIAITLAPAGVFAGEWVASPTRSDSAAPSNPQIDAEHLGLSLDWIQPQAVVRVSCSSGNLVLFGPSAQPGGLGYRALLAGADSAEGQPIAWSDISAIESWSDRRAGNAVAYGVIGAILGGLIVLPLTQPCEKPGPGEFIRIDFFCGAPKGIIALGAITGALVGASVASASPAGRWRRVYSR